MTTEKTNYFERKAKDFLRDQLSQDIYRRVMLACNDRVTLLDQTNIVLVAGYTRTEPWVLINEYGLGRGRQWFIDDLVKITRDYNCAELCAMQTTAA